MNFVTSIASALKKRLLGAAAPQRVASHPYHSWRLSHSSTALERAGGRCLFRTRLEDNQPSGEEAEEDHAGQERGSHKGLQCECLGLAYGYAKVTGQAGRPEDAPVDGDLLLLSCNDWLSVDWIEVQRVDPDEEIVVTRALANDARV